MATVCIAGKEVVLRDRLPIGEFHAFVAAARVMFPVGSRKDGSPISFEEQVGPILPIIESWEFPCDPHDLAAVGVTLDSYEEFIPLWNAISDHINAKIVAMLEREKNEARPPILPQDSVAT
jgi:hypothetical protein